MATTQLTTCDREGCKAQRTPQNEKGWIRAYGLSDDLLLFGPLVESNADVYERMQPAFTTDLDFCSARHAQEYTAELLGWKKPGRPKGSKNKPKEQAA